MANSRPTTVKLELPKDYLRASGRRMYSIALFALAVIHLIAIMDLWYVTRDLPPEPPVGIYYADHILLPLLSATWGLVIGGTLLQVFFSKEKPK